MNEHGLPPINQIPPNDQEAERGVLSGMLFDREAVLTAVEILKPEDFYQPANRLAFEAMMELFMQNKPVDAITVHDKLGEKGVIDQMGGREFITELAALYFTSANVEAYCRIIEEKSTLRKLIKASQSISQSSFQAKEPLGQILEKAEKSIFDIIEGRQTADFSPIHEVLTESIEKIEKIYYSKAKLTGLETGFYDFDMKTSGLQPSDLVLLAARPSMGKTAFVLNIAQHAAVRKKVTTAIFSLEMSKEQLVNRLLCQEAMLDSQRLRNGDLRDEDWAKIAAAMEPLANASLYIDDTPGISVAEVRAKCRKLKMEKNLGLVIIDYLQLMTGSSKSDNRQQEISEISRSLKAIAREVSAPVIALSQLSRACEQRADHRPMLSDLRESGAIEQDADLVCFLYRDEYYNPDTDKKSQAELIIAKQRNGPTGTVDLMWLSQYTKFTNMLKNHH